MIASQVQGIYESNLLRINDDVAAAVAELLLLLSGLLQRGYGLPFTVELSVVLGLVPVHKAEVPPLLAHHCPLIRLHQGRDGPSLVVTHVASSCVTLILFLQQFKDYFSFAASWEQKQRFLLS